MFAFTPRERNMMNMAQLLNEVLRCLFKTDWCPYKKCMKERPYLK